MRRGSTWQARARQGTARAHLTGAAPHIARGSESSMEQHFSSALQQRSSILLALAKGTHGHLCGDLVAT